MWTVKPEGRRINKYNAEIKWQTFTNIFLVAVVVTDWGGGRLLNFDLQESERTLSAIYWELMRTLSGVPFSHIRMVDSFALACLTSMKYSSRGERPGTWMLYGGNWRVSNRGHKDTFTVLRTGKRRTFIREHLRKPVVRQWGNKIFCAFAKR